MAIACANPLEALPHTVFPEQKYHYLQQQQAPAQCQPQHINFPPPEPSSNCFSPQSNRDFYLEQEDQQSALQNQVSIEQSMGEFQVHELKN